MNVNILDPATQKIWDQWVDTRARSVALGIVDAAFDVLNEEHVRDLNAHAKTIVKLVEIVQELASGNAALSKEVKKISKSFAVDDTDAAIGRALDTVNEVLAMH